MKHKLLIYIFSISMLLNAQKKEEDRNAIKSMRGCYRVNFNFIETFNYSKDTAYNPSKEKHEKALECVLLVEDKEDKITLQHILLVGSPSKPHIIKHWRQDWLYENTVFYTYYAGNKWKFLEKSPDQVRGQWTQNVFQVDDSPRYTGSATWIHVDGKSFWENTADAPLPRREYTIRDDYDVTVRRNRHEITPEGWVHEQYNDKVIRREGKKDIVLAQEKGYNSYTRVDDLKCKAAEEWWEKNRDMWALVRENWNGIFAKNRDLELMDKVDEKHLYDYLFDLDPHKTKNKDIKKIIKSFISVK